VPSPVDFLIVARVSPRIASRPSHGVRGARARAHQGRAGCEAESNTGPPKGWRNSGRGGRPKIRRRLYTQPTRMRAGTEGTLGR